MQGQVWTYIGILCGILAALAVGCLAVVWVAGAVGHAIRISGSRFLRYVGYVLGAAVFVAGIIAVAVFMWQILLAIIGLAIVWKAARELGEGLRS